MCNTKYKIIPNKKLGEGAQGAVYLTIKNKKEYVTKNPISKKEAELSKVLSSIGPKIYDIYECKTLEETKNITLTGEKLKFKGRFMVMEKLTGLDLNDYIQEDGIFIEDDDTFINTLINKIKKMHKLGYHHNDLSTSNVFVVFDKINNVKDIRIIDFGHTKKITKKGEEDDFKTLLKSINMFGIQVTDKIQPLIYAIEDELEKYQKPKKIVSVKKPSIKKVIKRRTIKIKKKQIKIKKKPIKIKRKIQKAGGKQLIKKEKYIEESGILSSVYKYLLGQKKIEIFKNIF